MQSVPGVSVWIRPTSDPWQLQLPGPTLDSPWFCQWLRPKGCGKTTLLRTVAGERSPLAGQIKFPAHLSRARAYQIPRWQTGLLRDHLRDAAIDETRFRSIMGCFGVVGEIFDRPPETFGQGQRKKVDLCRSFVSPAQLLIWDEPVNSIDLMSREMIEDLVRQHEPAILFVEHDRRFVERIAPGIIDLTP